MTNFRCILLSDSRSYPENPPPGLGAQIMQAIGPSLFPWSTEDPNILKFGRAMHAVLVSELQLFDEEEREERESHLQRIVTTYMVFAHLSMSPGA
jgi:hypothetical protein